MITAKGKKHYVMKKVLSQTTEVKVVGLRHPIITLSTADFRPEFWDWNFVTKHDMTWYESFKSKGLLINTPRFPNYLWNNLPIYALHSFGI